MDLTKTYQYEGFNTDTLRVGMLVSLDDHCYDARGSYDNSGTYFINGFENDNKTIRLINSQGTILKIKVEDVICWGGSGACFDIYEYKA
jgi:hypothetical protein